MGSERTTDDAPPARAAGLLRGPLRAAPRATRATPPTARIPLPRTATGSSTCCSRRTSSRGRTPGPRSQRLGPEFGDQYWAPEVCRRDGAWWMYYSVGHDISGHHIRVARADEPTGPFLDLGVNLTPGETFAIDPHPFQDDDGRWYLFFARDVLEGDRPGTHLAVGRLDSPTELTDVAAALVPGRGLAAVRARPIDVRRRVRLAHTGGSVRREAARDRYWMTYSGGAWTGPGYQVSWASAPHPLGPWQAAPQDAPPILATSELPDRPRSQLPRGRAGRVRRDRLPRLERGRHRTTAAPRPDRLPAGRSGGRSRIGRGSTEPPSKKRKGDDDRHPAARAVGPATRAVGGEPLARPRPGDRSGGPSDLHRRASSARRAPSAPSGSTGCARTSRSRTPRHSPAPAARWAEARSGTTSRSIRSRCAAGSTSWITPGCAASARPCSVPTTRSSNSGSTCRIPARRTSRGIVTSRCPRRRCAPGGSPRSRST